MSNALRNAALLSGAKAKTVTGARPPFYSLIDSRPSPLGNHDSITTAFDGYLGGLILPIEHRVTGSGTLGTPTGATEYLYTPEAAGIYLQSYNSSGYNHSTSGNGGRTAATAIRVKVFNAGQGDHVAFNASGFVAGTKAGSTNFLANPAAVLFNGDLQGGADGVYLNPYETALSDGGFDVAGIGAVHNLTRTVSTGAKSAVWIGYRVQSKGAASIDNIISATGKALVGIDFSMSSLDFGANAAAISLRSGQRIYFNNNALASGNLVADWRTTGFNGDYIQHTTSGFTGLNVVQAGSSRLQIGATVTVNTAFAIAIGSVGTYASDALAAAGGVPVGGVYRNGSALQIRVT